MVACIAVYVWALIDAGFIKQRSGWAVAIFFMGLFAIVPWVVIRNRPPVARVTVPPRRDDYNTWS